MEKRKPKIVIAPKGCMIWFTEGKEYEVIDFWDDWDDKHGYGFSIHDDDGEEVYCKQFNCATLSSGNWIVKEYEMSIEDAIKQELERKHIKICYVLSTPISVNSDISIISLYRYSCILKQEEDEFQMPYVYLSDYILNKILEYLKTK